MTPKRLTCEQIDLVAERFRALAEPARLRIVNELRSGERTVGALVDATDMGTANVSKHLQVLHAAGFVARRKEGLCVHYSLDGEEVFLLCEILCDRMKAQGEARRKILSGR